MSNSSFTAASGWIVFAPHYNRDYVLLPDGTEYAIPRTCNAFQDNTGTLRPIYGTVLSVHKSTSDKYDIVAGDIIRYDFIVVADDKIGKSNPYKLDKGVYGVKMSQVFARIRPETWEIKAIGPNFLVSHGEDAPAAMPFLRYKQKTAGVRSATIKHVGDIDPDTYASAFKAGDSICHMFPIVDGVTEKIMGVETNTEKLFILPAWSVLPLHYHN